MSLNLEDKKAVVAEVCAQLASAQTVVVAEYRGVEVNSMTKLRVQARDNGVYLRVINNTLVRRAVIGSQFESLTEHLFGPLIYSISADPIAAARVLHQFAKVDDKIIVKAGSYNGQLMSVTQVAELASVPSRDELLARLLGVMLAPVSGFARALAALAEKKQAQTA